MSHCRQTSLKCTLRGPSLDCWVVLNDVAVGDRGLLARPRVTPSLSVYRGLLSFAAYFVVHRSHHRPRPEVVLLLADVRMQVESLLASATIAFLSACVI